MEQFSHDLTLALEETSRSNTNKARWGMRRRTRSTGNLPCAPQPTEDSSSSPTDPPYNVLNNPDSPHLSGSNNMIQSDSDDRHSLAFAYSFRQTPLSGNFESDSVNENFSPARPNMRRKRKFKRMAVEYETTPSTPHISSSSLFPVTGAVKKRVFKHTCADNFRSSMFFCGKRKRSQRDRGGGEYDFNRQHPNSIPRGQRELFNPKASSYLEYKNRNRAASFSASMKCERILPLNKSIVSKIEKISQNSQRSSGNNNGNKTEFKFSVPARTDFNSGTGGGGGAGNAQGTGGGNGNVFRNDTGGKLIRTYVCSSVTPSVATQTVTDVQPLSTDDDLSQQKSDTFKLACGAVPIGGHTFPSAPEAISMAKKSHSKEKHRIRKSKYVRKKQMMMMEDQHYMDCGVGMHDVPSSSSLSSSDSEAILANETDHEGDDELTDWPGNEAMITFASKHDFRKSTHKNRFSRTTLPQIKQQDDIQDDDTLMSADDLNAMLAASSDVSCALQMSSEALGASLPLNFGNTASPFDGETVTAAATNFLVSSSPLQEIREIRAGCRRVGDERPGFSIISSVNEYLSRFLQDDQQRVLTLYGVNAAEHDKLQDLCKLYSLNVLVDTGSVTLTKTSNTMQSVRVDQSNLPKRLGDFKRRCYGNSESLQFQDGTS